MVDEGATNCPSCGRALSDDVLLLQPHDDAAGTTTVVAHESRRPRVPPRTVAIVGAVITLIAIASIVSSGGGSSAGRTTSTTIPTSSVSPTATIPPSVPTTVQGPLLAGQNLGVLVESISTGLRLTDIATGESKVVRDSTLADAGVLIPRAGGVVAAHDTPIFVPLPAGDPLVALSMPQGATAVTVYPSFTPDHLWLEEFRDDGTREVVEVDVFGVPSGQPVALPAAATVVGAVAEGLVVGAAGSVYVVPTGGPPRRVARGDPVAAAGHTIVVLDCGESLVCSTFDLIDSRDGSMQVAHLPYLTDANVNGIAAISSDGTRVAVSELSGNVVQLAVVDTQTLTVTPVPSGTVGLATTSVVWSPDAHLLFWPVGSDGIRVWRVGDTTSQVLGPRPDKFEAFTVVPNAGPLS